MQKKNILIVTLLALIVVGILAYFWAQAPTSHQQAEAVTIGAILPLTGPAARYGQWVQEGLELALKEINEGDGVNGRPLEIIYEDDQAQPSQAANAMQKLATVNKVPLVYGSWASSSVLAQAPIAEREKVVIMAEAISPRIRDAGDYTFRCIPDARLFLDPLVPFVYENGDGKVAILYINNDFGVDQAEIFQERFEKLGGEITTSEGYDPEQRDFRPHLTKVMKTKPDGVFLPGYAEIGHILRQAKELGFESQFYSSGPFENQDIITTAGQAADGVIYAHYYDAESDNPIMQSFQTKYQEEYGKTSEGFAATGYNGLKNIVHVALTKAGPNPQKLKQTLYDTETFPGLFGDLRFDEKGDVNMPIFIKTVQNGEFVRLK